MKTNNKYKLVALGVDGAALGTLAAFRAAANAACDTTGGISAGTKCAQDPSQPTDLNDNIRTITNILLFLVGVTAVIMLIVGGFQYIFSAGDSSKTATAKNTIIFSIVGIVVALLSYAIIQFVLGQFSG